jgi:hypothetical protein
MPYIKKEDRERARLYPRSAGELNYAVTILIKSYIKHNCLSYQTINDILGALEGAKAEFYRRVAVPYEDMKISTNGDVY